MNCSSSSNRPELQVCSRFHTSVCVFPTGKALAHIACIFRLQNNIPVQRLCFAATILLSWVSFHLGV
uniref:Uncharacterized protein n=1 Tax=Oryza brachyantha TaxID=4533 RepID=J3LIZ4_ORYBR